MTHRPRSSVRPGLAQRGFWIALGLLLVALLILGAATARRLGQHLSSAQMALGQIETALSSGSEGLATLLQDPQQVRQLDAALVTLDRELASIEKLAGPFLPIAPYFGWFPGVGGDIEAAPHLLTMARQTTGAARSLSSIFLPLLDELEPGKVSLQSLGPALTTRILEGQPQLDQAGNALDHATQARSQFDAGRLSAKTRRLVDRFDRLLPLMRHGPDLLAALPELFGADRPRTYLILAQNNHELRATGGFISGVGLVQVDRGQIVRASFQDSYAVDNLNQPHPWAPDPLRRHMGSALLMLRDANWWPDFPTSARTVADLYRQDQGVAVDGVIAVDLTTLQLFLNALGPISVPGYDQPVTGANLTSMIATSWESPRMTAPGKEGADWWLHRKDLAADLMAELVPAITQQADAQKMADLGRATFQALRQRHLLIYVDSPKAHALLHQLGWDGALRIPEGDTWLVVDSNVGFNKVNPNIDQTLDYTLQLDATGQATATLTLAYSHRIQRPTPACIHESRYGDRYQDLMERCYWDYVRVYLPQGSELVGLLGADGPHEVYDEADRTVVAFSMLLGTAESRQIRLVYRPSLPPLTGEYRLLVQKQPGTGAIPLRLQMILPAGAAPQGAQPEGLVWLDGIAIWQGDLSEDREFYMTWQ